MEITDFRFVRPVTTARGKSVTAPSVGLGSELAGADAAGLGEPVEVGGLDCVADGDGAGLSHAASSAATRMPDSTRSLGRARTAPGDGAEPAGTSGW